MIDIGGQSSHLDNPTIEASDEIARVVPVIEALAAEGHLVAIDTWKADVAGAAIDAGAVIINDTGGLADTEMRQLVAQTGVAAVAVYVEGQNPHEVGEIEIREDKAAHTASAFQSLLAELGELGIDNVILDPGIALNYRGDYEAYTRMQIQVIADSEHLRDFGQADPHPDPTEAGLRSASLPTSPSPSSIRPTSSGSTTWQSPATWCGCSGGVDEAEAPADRRLFALRCG